MKKRSPLTPEGGMRKKKKREKNEIWNTEQNMNT